MECTLTKKCAFCGKEMIISKSDMNMISFKNKNYHIECFKIMCNERVLKNNRYSLIYADALKNIDEIKKETNSKLINRLIQDELNIYLLAHYDVGAFSGRFWDTIHDVQKGIYKNRKCVVVDLETLFEMWKVGQKKLDSTNNYNNTHGKPMNGEERVFYDLAILMSNYEKFKKKKEKEAAASKEVQESIKNTKENINYHVLTKKEEYDKVNIASLVDEIF